MSVQEHRHACTLNSADDAYGAAISACYEEDGRFWAGNEEYRSQVNYCPACGVKAPLPAEPWSPRAPRYGWVPDGRGSRFWGLLATAEAKAE